MNTFEKIKSSFDEKEKFISVNELVSYGMEDDFIHIHIVPEKKVENIISKFREGLEELAKIVDKNENIKEISATSWLIAQSPEALEKRYGFTIDGKISEEFKKAHFADEKREVWGAHIDREEFLKRYLRK